MPWTGSAPSYVPIYCRRRWKYSICSAYHCQEDIFRLYLYGGRKLARPTMSQTEGCLPKRWSGINLPMISCS
eukprot:scaffold1163_cov193-Alexandrium_tamarense.AAC.32